MYGGSYDYMSYVVVLHHPDTLRHAPSLRQPWNHDCHETIKASHVRNEGHIVRLRRNIFIQYFIDTASGFYPCAKFRVADKCLRITHGSHTRRYLLTLSFYISKRTKFCMNGVRYVLCRYGAALSVDVTRSFVCSFTSNLMAEAKCWWWSWVPINCFQYMGHGPLVVRHHSCSHDIIRRLPQRTWSSLTYH